MIKDIVVSLSVGAVRDGAADYAISLARLFEAHVAGVAFAYEPMIVGSVLSGAVAETISAQHAASKSAAQNAMKKFGEAAQRNGLQSETRMLDATLDGAPAMFARAARRFDIAVLPQATPDNDGPEQSIIEGALFNSGRPVLIVPYIQKSDIKLDRVLVGWDGSRSAARAVGDAIPLLARAKAVDLVIVSDHASRQPEIPGADFAQHLSRHTKSVDLKNLVADTDVPNTILSYASDTSADFIVMGGYGHSRLREFILGGATRGILESMTIPTLMSH